MHSPSIHTPTRHRKHRRACVRLASDTHARSAPRSLECGGHNGGGDTRHTRTWSSHPTGGGFPMAGLGWRDAPHGREPQTHTPNTPTPSQKPRTHCVRHHARTAESRCSGVPTWLAHTRKHLQHLFLGPQHGFHDGFHIRDPHHGRALQTPLPTRHTIARTCISRPITRTERTAEPRCSGLPPRTEIRTHAASLSPTFWGRPRPPHKRSPINGRALQHPPLRAIASTAVCVRMLVDPTRARARGDATSRGHRTTTGAGANCPLGERGPNFP